MDSQNITSNNQPQSSRAESYKISGNLSLAMAYIVIQPEIKRVYYTDDALRQGTLFPELDKPFLGSRGAN